MSCPLQTILHGAVIPEKPVTQQWNSSHYMEPEG